MMAPRTSSFVPFIIGIVLGILILLLVAHERDLSERCAKKGGTYVTGRCLEIHEIQP
jgi:hypothetical protein